MFYTISEMAEKLGVSASTLRYYDQQGLLPFVERSSGGIRRFSDRDFAWLKVIECLKRSGLSIRDIKAFTDMAERGDESLNERLALFSAQRDAVRKQMAEIQETLDILEFKRWYYERAVQDGTEEIVRSLPLEEIPERYRETKMKLDSIHQLNTG